MANTLHTGDIMVKHNDGSLVNNLISFGQLFGRGSSKYTHAGILSDKHRIIEMDGHGLQEHDLRNENRGVTYDVFHCTVKELRYGAAEVAKMMLANFGSQSGNPSITYSKGGAFKSISSRTAFTDDDVANTSLDKLLQSGDAFFCSGHVVLCYQIAASQMQIENQLQNVFPVQQINQLFSLQDVCYQPAYLQQVLSKQGSGFTFTGTFTGTVKQT